MINFKNNTSMWNLRKQSVQLSQVNENISNIAEGKILFSSLGREKITFLSREEKSAPLGMEDYT